MKNIGIKLADGTFYPVLKDNVPSEKALKLTTAHNNQTKVMVDLYRSETDSMEDAEYVDSLQIENLVAHPNGEPDIAFSISLDDENQLSAKIVDEETGKQSNTSITLVSRTIEERLYTDEYNIKDLELPTTKRKGLLAAASALLGTSAAVAATAPKAEAEVETPVLEETTIAEEPVEESAPVMEESVIEEPVVVEEEAPTDEETFVDEPTLEDFALPVEEPITEEASEEIPDDSMSFDLPDLEDTMPAETVAAEAEEETAPAEFTAEIEEEAVEPEVTPEVASEDSLPDMDFDLPDMEDTPEATEEPLPDFNFDSIIESNTEADETVIEETPMFTPDENIADIDIDFTVPVTPLAANSLDSYEFTLDKEEDLDLNDMNLDFDFPDIDEKTEDTNILEEDIKLGDEDMSKKSYSGTNSNGGISFTGLYDKETELGTSANTDDSNCKKTKAPVVICIICAIICILATAFVLFLVPSKFNILGKTGNDNTAVVVQPVEEPTPAPEPVVEPEPEPEVEEIVIIEKAEEVIPEQPPVAVEKPKDISYKIKWGDTLWDISDTYYKNPWRYKYIARFNGIKDPDYIISGTYITIPAE